MHHSIKILSAFAALVIATGCTTTEPDRGTDSSGMHRADSTQAPTGDEPVNCAPDKIGSAAGQGSDCRHGTGGATSTPPDSSSSNNPDASTSSPPH